MALLINSPLWAQAGTNQLESILRTQTQKAQQKSETLSLNQVLEQLQNEKIPHLSWQEFLKQNEHVKEVEKASTKLENHLLNNQLGTLKEDANSNLFYHALGLPPYSQLIKGQNTIFIAESINHEAASSIDHAANIIRIIRKENPHARILLASEFLNWLGDEAPGLLKKAGEKTNLYISEGYMPVFRAADQANIDQLALDDFIWITQENTSIVKIGNFAVYASPEDKVPSLNLAQDKLEDLVLSTLNLVSVSPWGVRERNRQWARRINALRPFYDIIIVHAGDGHIAATYSMDLAPMLHITDYLLISLLPLEQLPEDKQILYENRSNIAETNGLCRNGVCYEQDEDLINKASEQISFLPQEVDAAKDIFWIYPNEEAVKKLNATQEQKKLKKAYPYSTDKNLLVFIK